MKKMDKRFEGTLKEQADLLSWIQWKKRLEN